MSGGLFGSLGISASGMAAQRLRMDVVAENLANAETTRGANGQPYQRKEVLFEDTLAGVQATGIVNDQSPARRVYDPGHPDADKDGYVSLPNVNPVTEMVDLITATRGYEANTQALGAAKQMFVKTLDILR